MPVSNMYEQAFTNHDLSNQSFLVTGGAGFIGSNIVEYLLKQNARYVRVLDNLSTGYLKNIAEFINYSNFEFIEGDISDFKMCEKCLKDIDYISHQAALGSVPRSIENPINTNNSNVTGFLNMLVAAREEISVKRMVYAASSSTYGDSESLPKIEENIGNPLSPYAVTKYVNELYADVFSKCYNFHTIGLRYFNIFGPKQRPGNAYAAVIPLFCEAFIEGEKPTINGDGKTSRDFTFVENAVQANIRALLHHDIEKHTVFNVACNNQITLNELHQRLQEISQKDIEAIHGPERAGDIRHSFANIEKISAGLGYEPTVQFPEGLEIIYNWYKENL